MPQGLPRKLRVAFAMQVVMTSVVILAGAWVAVEVAKHRELGLTDSEFELICAKLGRQPNDVELAMFSLLWSEHCAYKHSRKLLRRLPTEGERVALFLTYGINDAHLERFFE